MNRQEILHLDRSPATIASASPLRAAESLRRALTRRALTRLAFTLCAFTLGARLAMAQSAPAGPPDPQVRMAKLTQDLSLTPAQQPPFQAILDEERTNLMASMKQEREQNIDPATAHQNHQKIEDVAMAKLKPLLSDEQFKKYQAIVEAEAYARHHRAPPGSPPPAGGPPG